MIILATICLWFYFEAWLEVIVIELKNGAHPNYNALNKSEHFRSAVLAMLTIAAAIAVISIYTQQWILLPAVVICRRPFFDWYLIVKRDRPRHRYEGSDWWANFFRRIFGSNGRVIEHITECVIIVACIVLHCIFSKTFF